MSNYSIYPKSLDGYAQLPLFVDRVTPLTAEGINRLRSAIVNIESALGINPQGNYDTAAIRISSIELDIVGIEERLDGIDASIEALELSVAFAQTTADGAQTAADAAQTTADGAQTAADAAQTTADGAQTAADAAQAEIDAIETSMGAMVNSSGVYQQFSGTNYIDGNADLTQDLLDLDAAIASVSGGSGITDVVDDLTPQLGGDLDVNGNDITGTGDINITGTVTADLFEGQLNGPVFFRGKAGEAILKGEVVYISGISGNTPIVMLAQANSPLTMPAFGIATENIPLNTSGEIASFGSVKGLDAAVIMDTGSPPSLGSTLYVCPVTAGKLSETPPSGESNLIQNIGKAERVTPSTNMTVKVGGAGRSNATPALDDGNIFIGDASNNSVTASLDTAVAGAGYIKELSEDLTPVLGGDLVIGNKELRFSAGGVVNLIDIDYDNPTDTFNSVCFSSVKSMHFFLDANGGDSNQYFGFYNNIDPHSGVVNADTAIAAISEGGDLRLAGSIHPIEQAANPGTNLVATGGYTTSPGDNGGNLILEGGVPGAGGDFGDIEIGPANTGGVIVGGATVPAIINGSVKFNRGSQRKTVLLPGSGGLVPHDCADAHAFVHTGIGSDFTADLVNLSLEVGFEAKITLFLVQGPTPYYANALQIAGAPQSIKWRGGAPPALTANGIDILMFTIVRTGPAIYQVMGSSVGYL